MSDISIQVARLEKEFNFWTEIYTKELPSVRWNLIEQINQLESSVENYRNLYRKELESDLGKDFSVDELSGMAVHNPLINHFFPLKYGKDLAGIILPFRPKKKVIFSFKLKDNKVASDVFSNKGYNIEQDIDYFHNIVEMCDLVTMGDEEGLNLVLQAINRNEPLI